MSAHVLFNLLNKLEKKDKMRGLLSTVILLPSADSFRKGCCQLQAKVCAQITG